MSVSIDSSKGIDSKGTPVIQKISPRIIPGILTSNNKGAIDWGWQSFIAFGCNNHVIVIDTENVKIFQTLEMHKSDVVKVKWAKEKYYHDLDNPYTLKLASSDITGTIIIWDVKEGKAVSSFSDSTKPIADMQWFTGRDNYQHLLVALHPPYSVIVWDTKKECKIWKKSYTETLVAFAFDPFTENNMAFLASDCILFVDDFSITKTPSSNGRKFYVTNPSSSVVQQTSSFSSSASSDDRARSAPRSIIPRRMRFLVKADSKSSDDRVTLNECIQLSYHRSFRHHLLLLYPREVLILDLEINQTVGIVSVEHSSSPMAQLYSCWQRDVFLILYENGSIGFHLRHSGHTIMAAATPSNSDISFSSSDTNLEVTYDLLCLSDALRLTKHAKVVGVSVCPVSESKIALLVSDGRLFFLDLGIIQKKYHYGCWTPHLSELFTPLDMSKSDSESVSEKSHLPYPCQTDHPANVLSDNIGPALYPHEKFSQNIKESLKFKLYITGNLCALTAPPHVIKMCPPVTFRNWTTYRPLMAVGNSSGSIQIFDMATGIMEREYSVHTCPVRGIEWLGLTSFMSFGHPNTTSSLGRVKNELVMCDIQSGRTKALRVDRSEESPIEMLRVSCLKQYVIIVFKEEPFELWDLRHLTLLRIMPKNFPSVTALEWSPAHSRKQQSSQDLMLNKVEESGVSSEALIQNDPAPKSLIYVKEHFVFTDTNGQLYHFSVEGNVVKDVSTIPADAGMGSVTCIAWKGDYIVLGDVDGNLNVLNLKEKISKGLPTHRGWIKKIRFGPGRGNMKILVLYNDGVDLRDVKEGQNIYQVRCPRELPKVQDIDWVSSDRPCLATSDGCLRITDITLKLCTSPVYDYQPSGIPFSPHILSTKVAFYLKSYLHHLLLKQKFNADIDQQDDFDMLLAENQLEALDNELKHFLKDCPFGTAERCLHVSRLFGDEEGCYFWTVALFVLKEVKYQSNIKKRTDDSVSAEASTTDVTKSLQSKLDDTEYFFDQPLDTGYDVLCDSETYKKLQLDRVFLHVYKRTTHNQTQQCAERLLLLGQMEKAVQLLLETEAGNENFYVDCLRACLIATVQSSGTSQSIIKLVSTNLIANGHIFEGVQLLCLINKGLDACRYLQGAGRWDEAVWLAKATLPSNECQDILKRWVDHLCLSAVNQKNKALLVLLTMHQFWKAILLMHDSKMSERAALFLQACLEFGLISRNEDNSAKIDAVFLEYSKYLLSVKNRTSAIHYCKLVSNIGDDLRKQIEFMNEEY